MDFQEQQDQGICWITVTGRLDGETSDAFDRRLQALIDHGLNRFALDFSGVTYLNSRGLSSLIHLSQTATRRNGGVVILGLAGPVKDVFEAVQLESLIALAASREDAARILNPSGD